MIQRAATCGVLIVALAVSLPALRALAAEVPNQNRWLRVDGRFIVDAAGHPFRLVGMGRYQPDAGMDNKLLGDMDEVCLHYKQLGMNAMRVAIGGRNDWMPDCDVAPYGGFDGYVETSPRGCRTSARSCASLSPAWGATRYSAERSSSAWTT
jgi:hypothetical protein